MDSFEDFFKKNENLIYKITKSYVKNSETAKDIVVESFIEVYNRWDRIKNLENPEGYLVRIAINKSKKFLLMNKVKSFMSLISEDGEFLDVKSTKYNPENQFFISEENKILEEALDRLKPIEKNIIIIKDLEEKTFEEISKILNMKLPTVKSHYRRGKIKLANYLEENLKEGGVYEDKYKLIEKNI